MNESKHRLFDTTSSEQEKHSAKAQIAAMRAQARDYRDRNNALVDQIWDLEQKIVQLGDDKSRERLIKEKEAISSQIDEAGYIPKLNALLDEIKALEISVYGHSDVGGDSPYQL